jgi:hypothetical protein
MMTKDSLAENMEAVKKKYEVNLFQCIFVYFFYNTQVVGRYQLMWFAERCYCLLFEVYVAIWIANLSSGETYRSVCWAVFSAVCRC